MAQSIRPMNNQLSYAEEALPMANAARGNQGMNLPNPGARNSMDGGHFSNVNMNPQIQINNGHAMQNMQQNMSTAEFQAGAAAQGVMRKEIANQSNAESRAQQSLNENLANIMLSMPTGGQAMMTFQQNKDKIMNDVAVSSAMYQKGMK